MAVYIVDWEIFVFKNICVRFFHAILGRLRRFNLLCLKCFMCSIFVDFGNPLW